MSRSKAVRSVTTAVQREMSRPNSRLMQQMRRAMAERLLKLVQTDYMTKAHGGTDASGARWEPTQRSQEQGGLIMYQTGKLFRGFKIVMTDSGFKIINSVSYASAALGKRPAYPDQLPPAWIRELTEVAQPYIAHIIEKAIRSIKGATVDKAPTLNMTVQ